jgi:peptide/nickel transport system ATP-binding protein
MAFLEVADLSVEFMSPGRPLRAVDQVSFVLEEGEVLGIVGESGSGKTVACRSILHLLPSSRARIASGSAMFERRNLLALPEAELRRLRGSRLAMIFQNPSTHLDPLMTIGRQVAEPLIYHRDMSWREARRKAIDLLRQVGIPDPARNVDAFPHQFSGGMRQRAMIAAAIACEPRLLIADEPTTALDVTVQAQILRLLLELRDRTGLSIILITHDLGIVAATCDHVAVMYAGRIMERAAKAELLRRPLHPYTRGLMGSRPTAAARGQELPSIEGQLPPLADLPAGCRFHPRCDFAEARCRTGNPLPEPATATHATACIRWREVMGGEAVPGDASLGA